MKYKDWLKTWLELYVKPVVKEQTYIKYESIARLHIAPALGAYEIQQLKADILQRFVVEKAKYLSPNMVNSIVTVLQNSIKTAVMLGITDVNYSGKIIRPKSQEKKTECFTVSEQRKIERAIFSSKKQKFLGIIICLYTGLRIGELLALQWGDINMEKCLLSVNKSCHRGKNNSGEYEQIIDTPKTAQSVRAIPIPKQLIPYVKKFKEKCRLRLCNKLARQARQYPHISVRF